MDTLLGITASSVKMPGLDGKWYYSDHNSTKNGSCMAGATILKRMAKWLERMVMTKNYSSWYYLAENMVITLVINGKRGITSVVAEN